MNLTLRDGLPVRRPGVWLRQAGTENAVYDPLTGRLHILNDTALAIWHLCDGETSTEEMVSAICDLFNTERDVVVHDVNRILDKFESAGLLSWGE